MAGVDARATLHGDPVAHKARLHYYGKCCHRGGIRILEIDDYVVSTLMRDLVGHDRRPSAYLVYLYLEWLTVRSGSDRTRVSLRALAEGTGLSKRAVQSAIARLRRRRLIAVTRESITAIPEYRVLHPWMRRSPTAT